MTAPVVVAADRTPAGAAALGWATGFAHLLGAPLETCPGDPPDLLVAAARARAVVVGHAGPFALHRPLLAVVDHAACDVVVVRGDPRPTFDRVTALVTGTAHDAPVLAEAVELARLRGCALRVLHAVPPLPVRVDDAQWPVAHADQLLRGVRHTSVLARMHPHEAITRYADTDLLVTGDPGPVTRAALHHATCPVLVVRHPAVPHVPAQRDPRVTAAR
ncbi:hypothetical protein GCM10010492_74210 [Saccharothrix mutabilis subsp. mutabilis]|uniref:UspA domain-containing protein n=1 Tax=Saccharothrix mutabilis subsp. mutabilis TaxID=66855 RepID=A0ABN0UUW9_9PSEU